MFSVNPNLPVVLLVLYLVAAALAFSLCLISFMAIRRTKKTPYATKLLSLGLLSYDGLFLILSSISRLFAYDNLYMIQHLARGFHISAQIIVGSMALERFFVLSRPYLFLRLATEKRIKLVCGGVIVVSILQYVAVRGFACYARNRFQSCGIGIAIYHVIITITVIFLSYISYFKILKIIYMRDSKQKYKHSISQYKGTMVSLIYLVNTTFISVVYIGLSLFAFKKQVGGEQQDGSIGRLVDAANLVSCIIDPLIYVLWFKGTRMEVLKMVKVVCPFVKPTIEKMRIDIYNIQITSQIKPET